MPEFSPDDRRTADRSDATARRTRLRLRELCDEVIASHRAATDGDPFTAEERAAAAAVLDAVAPQLAGRTAR